MQKTLPAPDAADLQEINEGLEKVFRVSEYLNFPFTVQEVADYFLPGVNITSEQLRTMISDGNFHNIPFRLSNGYLVTSLTQSDSSRLQREQMSAAKFDSASRFAVLLRRFVPFINTVAVTGSVAYGSADRWDDIDLFIVTKRNRLWLTTSMTLLLVRLNKMLGLRPSHLSPFCLSYVHDEEGFAKESLKNRANPLFARELLKAKPIVGADQYRRILENNDWVGSFYSEAYSAKLQGLNHETTAREIDIGGEPRSVSWILDWAEAIAYALLSRYLRVRAYLTNLRFESQGLGFRVFEPKISTVSCVYNSTFYDWLRTLWGD